MHCSGIRTIARRGKLTIRVGVWVKVKVSFRVGGKPDNCLQGKLHPVRVRVCLRVSFGVRGQFSSGTIVLEPLFPNDKQPENLLIDAYR